MDFTESLIARHEGTRLSVYKDTVRTNEYPDGIATIGIGFNLESNGAKAICNEFNLDYDGLLAGRVQLIEAQAIAIFEHQLEAVYAAASITFPIYCKMPEKARAVIADLIFNMGYGSFLAFKDTITSLKAGDWKAAADHLTNSLWFKQVGTRAIEDVALLRSI